MGRRGNEEEEVRTQADLRPVKATGRFSLVTVVCSQCGAAIYLQLAATPQECIDSAKSRERPGEPLSNWTEHKYNLQDLPVPGE